MTHRSHGYRHHADSTTECPGCGRRHRTGTTVAERPDGNVEVTFRSKQSGKWGRIVVATETVEWSENHPASTPAPEPEPIVALVTVDDSGRLTAESTVTVGEWTWPVPERAEHGGVLWMSRVGQVLKEHGWRPQPDWRPMASTLGEHYSEVRIERIERIETND